jgi:hypothetical protein
MPETIKVSATFSVPASKIYNAWLDGKEHSAMTEGKATASTAGRNFTLSRWENISIIKIIIN